MEQGKVAWNTAGNSAPEPEPDARWPTDLLRKERMVHLFENASRPSPKEGLTDHL